MKRFIKIIVVLLVVGFTAIGCTEELLKSDYDYKQNPSNVPQDIVTGAVSELGVVSAFVSGSVEEDSTLLDWGVVYYTLSMAANDKYLVKTAKTAKYDFNFNIQLTGLVPDTEYLCKTFAMNSDGISYGEEVSFKTEPASPLPFQLLSTDGATAWQAVDFTIIDADGDGHKWGLFNINADNDIVGLRSYSWYNAALSPENYVILPPIQLGAAAAKVDLDVYAGDASYFEEKYKVVISTAPINTVAEARAATTLYSEVLPSASKLSRTINIPDTYRGRVVWIGICHFDCEDMYYIALSSIKVY